MVKLFSRTALIALVAAAASLGCEGEVDMDDMSAMNNSPSDEEPGPIQDRMPTEDDCGTDDVFTNDAPARLLTRYEYDNTVRDLLGLDAELARENFPPENSTGGFENSVDSHVVNPLLVRRYLEVAETLAATAVQENGYPENGFLPDLLYRAFRRPPTGEELDAFETLYTEAKANWETDRAQEMVIAAVLQSPQFLYRIEFADDRQPKELVKNDSFEMASRLSYMIWSTMPDETLFQAAEAGELETPEQIESQVRRMLQDPKARETVGHFYRQWLHLDALSDAVKDEQVYAAVPEDAVQDWRASIDEFIQWVHFDQDGSLQTLMTADTVFMTPDLAPMYEADASGGMTPVSMEHRAGLLTQPALLALLAYPDQTSPIHRGIFVREKLLCQPLPPPPDDMMIEPPDPDPDATTRERFAQHSENDACAGCHQMIDPIGFGFERYDGVGRYRATENGRTVDASGELLGSGDDSADGEFDGAVELSQRLAGSSAVTDCVADQWTTFALGRTPTSADLCSVNEIRRQFAESDGKFEDLFVAIATSDAMRFRVVQSEPTDDGGQQ
jgi:hypothetical protein